MNISKYLIIGCAALSMCLSSCVGDLNVEPDDPNKKLTLNSAQEYLQLLSSAYYGLASMSGLSVDDGGSSQYTRSLFMMQEIASDEAIIAGNWDDAGVDQMGFAIPSTDNVWVYYMACRIYYQIALCNEFIRDINEAGDFFSEDEITEMKAEARVLRDLSYYHMIDIFGKGPWTDENSTVGATPPTYDRQQLYDFLVADLEEAVPLVNPAAQQEYGRVSREAGLALLAKVYLNAGVYTGTPQWDKCAEKCLEITKTINNLAPTYKYLFCATNEKYVASSTFGTAEGEILWTIPFDENTLQCYGGSTYLSAGAYNTVADSNGDLERFGLKGGLQWNGPHMRPETTNNFSNADTRALFYTKDMIPEIYNIDNWEIAQPNGYMCVKFVYTPEEDYENTSGLYTHQTVFNSTDIPVFRLADIYLMLAECQLHDVACNGLEYYNKVRQRAGVGSVSSYTADDLLAERNRELYWECHRRSDLIRFGKYTGSTYNWMWKGGVQEGTALAASRNLMPIPYQFVTTLGQNPGY